MNQPYITAILAVTSLTFSAGAMAQNMSKSEYMAAEKNIVSEYKSARAECDAFADDAKDICMIVAKRKEKAAKAELEARYKPSKNARHEAGIAKAKADYGVTKEKCNAMSAMPGSFV